MPVIINEFEIIAERRDAGAQPPAAPAADMPPALHPQDIVRIMRRQQRRMARVRAD